MSNSTPSTPAKKGRFFEGARLWVAVSAGAAVIGGILILLLLQSVSATTTYYVLNSSVPARTLITPEMLSPVVTSQGGQPRTAIDISQVTNESVYSKFSLNQGDILTSSNAGSLSPLTSGLPGDFVIASFKVAPSAAAGGNVKRGDYIDLYAVTDLTGETQAHLSLQRVLVIDATQDLDGGSTPAEDGAETTTGAEGEDTTNSNISSTDRQGVPTLYTVGLSPTDAARLAVLTQGDIYVTLSSADSSADGATDADISATVTDIISGGVGDAGRGTDSTFGADDTKKDDNTSSSDPSASPAPTTPVLPSDPATEEPVTGDGTEDTGE